jgi:glycolate oxidase
VILRPPFPRPSAATVDKLRARLRRELGDSKFADSEEGCLAQSGDESDQQPVVPDAVVLAESAEDVATTLRVASELEVPVTPRAAGSGKSGGAVPVCGGVALSMLGMQQIKDIDGDELVAVVEPGAVLGDLFAAVEAQGLFYPPDPNSFSYCTLGGNIAENAGGPRAFKYGVTRDYVLGLDVITAEGARLAVGRRTRKGVTGYDLTALLVGSEGTLAVVLAATLRLIRKPDGVVTLLALFDRVDTTAAAVAAIVASGLTPRCIELIDEACLEAMRSEGVAVDPRAGALIIIEVDGAEPSCERAMERVGGAAMDAGALDVLVAQDAAQRERLWAVRRELSNVLRKSARFKISEDVVVPRSRLPELVAEVRRIGERSAVRSMSYGHAGDGNLHVNLLWDDSEQLPGVERALTELFTTTVRMGGTLSGEHGIGSSKAEHLPLEQGPELIAMQRRIKQLFDPKGILNPGKIFPRRGHGAC